MEDKTQFLLTHVTSEVLCDGKSWHIREWFGSDIFCLIRNINDEVKESVNYESDLCALFLTPLSLISNDDAIQLEMMVSQSKVWHEKMGKDFIISEGKKHAIQISKRHNPVCLQLGASTEIIDFLRYKGYALPWRNHSVEDLMEMGWIQLTRSKKK